MDVIRLRDTANILRTPANCVPYLSASEDKELDRCCYYCDNNSAECYSDEEELCQLANSKSLDSLNTLLDKLPDIVIPEPVYNPLPLQCLAANCLPESVRSEIDSVLREFCIVLKSPSHILRRHCAFEKLRCSSQVESMSGMGEQSAKKVEEGKCSEEDKVKSASRGESDAMDEKKEAQNGEHKNKAGEETDLQVSLQRLVVEKEVINVDNINDLGVGFRVSGGVKCSSCKSLHTVITTVSDHCTNPVVKEGLSVREWNGRVLEGCSNEEVRVFLRSSEQSQLSSVELLLQKCSCSGNFVTRPKEDGSRVAVLGTWQSMRRAKRPDMRLISKKRRSGKQEETSTGTSTGSESRQSDVPSSPTPTSSIPLAPPPLRSRRTSSPRPRSRSRSHSPSPSPETVPKGGSSSPRNENETTIVSIPRLNSNARELLARPRSPIATEDGHFSRFANGMIQLAMLYNGEVEDLQVALCRVKGQSNKEISDSSDVYINTYLIPDPRDQGVRSIAVNKSKHTSSMAADQLTSAGSFPVRTSGEEAYSYMLKKEELEGTAIRLILWDASKSKKTIFRGEVLLSLSDSSVISLTGQPMWFTVCPVDPNLPSLPKPVHYKHQQQCPPQQRNSALSKLMQKAQAITSSSAGPSMKQSVTLNDGFQHLSSIPPNVGKSGFTLRLSPKHRKVKSTHLDGNVLGMLNGARSVESLPATRHTINEAKLAKLSSIISVLKQSVEDGDDDNNNNNKVKLEDIAKAERKKRISTPEFVNIFKQPDIEENSNSTGAQTNSSVVSATADEVKKAKRRSRPPRTMVPLKEDFKDAGCALESGEISENRNSAPSGLNEQSMAWLASRKKDLGLAAASDDPYHKIPTLKESLHGGKLNRVSNYMFESSSEGHLMSDEPRAESDLGGNLDREANKSNRRQQIHYKLVDTKAQAEDDEEKTKQSMMNSSAHPISVQSALAVSSPDCKCYPVPVEVSVHRISVVDVDRQELERGDIGRTRSVDTRPAGVWSKKREEDKRTDSTRSSLHQMGSCADGGRQSGVFLRPGSGSKKERSRSVGDMESLSSGEEVLLIRTPCTGPQVAQHDILDVPKSKENDVNATHTLSSSSAQPHYNSIGMSYLDSTSRQQTSQKQSEDEEVNASPCSPPIIARRVKLDQPAEAPSSRGMLNVGDKNIRNRNSWVDILDKPMEGDHKLTKHRSMDNLIDPNDKRSSKSNWKQNYVFGQSAFLEGTHNQNITNEGTREGRITGSAKLQLEYNDLNPNKPVLLLKLLDILLQSSKNLSSELVLKCHVLHTSTRVCILKNKTMVNIKNPLPSAPLGILQFQTDFSNLSLEISFWSLGKLFSGKKEIGKVNLELNSLQLSRDSAYLEWVPILKSTTSA